MKDIQLIQAKQKDLEQIRNIYWGLLDHSKEYAHTLQWKKTIYPADSDWLFYIDRGEMYILSSQDTVVGAVALTKYQTDAYQNGDGLEPLIVHLLVISPEYQGKGMAVKALEAIVEKARELKMKVIRLDVIGTNVHAQKFYENFGFRSYRNAKLYYESTGLTDFIFYEYLVGGTHGITTGDDNHSNL